MYCRNASVALPRNRRAGARTVLALGWAAVALLTAAAPEDVDQPIRWRADQAEGDMAGRTILTGAVRMDQGTLRVDADRMVIEYAEQQVIRVVAEGDLAHCEQLPDAGAGPVRADAQKIIYHAAEGRIEFIGSARLTQNGNEFSGETIRYDLSAGAIDAVDEENGVRMVWQPQP